VKNDDSDDKEGRQKVEEIINVFKTERDRHLWGHRCREEKHEEGCERTDCVQLSLVMNICGHGTETSVYANSRARTCPE
jgi:hypothetical protein